MGNSKKQVIIDVRNPSEFEKGHAAGSLNIPLGEMNDRLVEIRKIKQQIVTVCGGGSRHKKAHTLLEENGISSIAGGSWKQY